MKRYHQTAPWIDARETPPEQATGAIVAVSVVLYPGGVLVED